MTGGGDRVADAATAATALEHVREVVTLGRDFARFESVRRGRPVAA